MLLGSVRPAKLRFRANPKILARKLDHHHEGASPEHRWWRLIISTTKPVTCGYMYDRCDRWRSNLLLVVFFKHLT